MDKSFEPMHSGHLLATNLQLNSDPQFAVNLPVWDDLEPDGLQLPLQVETQAGQCNKGPRKRKHLRSNGELNSDSRYDPFIEAQPKKSGWRRRCFRAERTGHRAGGGIPNGEG